VTGASRGIGRSIALELATRGCRIAAHYRRLDPVAQQATEALPGGEHVAVAADLAHPEEIDAMWDAAVRELGRIDILVNNAGVFTDHPPLGTSPAQWSAEWTHTLAINLLAPAQLCHCAANHMAAGEWTRERHGRGRIVNVSSRGAFRGEPHSPAYGASKAGLNSLSQSLAKALAPAEVYVYCLAPGWVETDMAAPYLTGTRRAGILGEQPLGRVATTAEIARAIGFCALDAPAAMTGAIIDLNGASYLRT
jgi:3-oxoacyl-[acyl-carrier protein] reductase